MKPGDHRLDAPIVVLSWPRKTLGSRTQAASRSTQGTATASASLITAQLMESRRECINPTPPAMCADEASGSRSQRPEDRQMFSTDHITQALDERSRAQALDA